MSAAPVRVGPLPVAAWQAAYPYADDSPAAEARRDQMFLRQALRCYRWCIEPCERDAYDARANRILARLDPNTTAEANQPEAPEARQRAA